MLNDLELPGICTRPEKGIRSLAGQCTAVHTWLKYDPKSAMPTPNRSGFTAMRALSHRERHRQAKQFRSPFGAAGPRIGPDGQQRTDWSLKSAKLVSRTAAENSAEDARFSIDLEKRRVRYVVRKRVGIRGGSRRSRASGRKWQSQPGRQLFRRGCSDARAVRSDPPGRVGADGIQRKCACTSRARRLFSRNSSTADR